MVEVISKIAARASHVLADDAWNNPAVRSDVLGRAKNFQHQLSKLGRMAPSRRQRNRVVALSRSFNARLCSLILSWRSKGPKLSVKSLYDFADQLDAWNPSGEPVRLSWMPKQKGGYRPIVNFGPEQRALQKLALLITQSISGDNRFEFARAGRGRDAAIRHILSKVDTTGGPRWFVVADVKNCFGSFDREGIKDILPLPKRMAEHCLFINANTNIINKHHHPHSEQAIRRGLPQGSLASPYIASKALEIVVAQLSGHVIVQHADDIFIAVPRKDEAEAVVQTLFEQMTVHPAGSLLVNFQVMRLGEVIDYLGYRVRRRAAFYGGGARVTPSKRSFDNFGRKYAERYALAETGPEAVAAAYVARWKNSQPCWDRLPISDTLLDIEILNEYRPAGKVLRNKLKIDISTSVTQP